MTRRGWGRQARRPRTKQTLRLDDGVRRMTEAMDGGLGMRLARLWRCWGEVMGDLSELARPLGRRRRTLIIGCEDAMVMQELSFFESETLDRIHEFLGEECFDNIRYELIEGRASLDMITTPSTVRSRPLPPRPRNLGGVRELMESDSAIGRSYRAYVALMTGREDSGREGGGQ
jgi:hypothetical protein